MLDGLLSPGSGFNASFCYNVSRGRLVTIQCDYPLAYYLEDLLYRTFVGCFFHLIEVLLLGALWFCNIWIQRDFTEAFLSSVAVPLSVSTVMKIATYVWSLLFPRELEKAWLIDMIYATSLTTAQLTLMQGLPVALYMAMKIGTSRRQNYGCCTWIPYFLNLLITFPLAAIFSSLYKPTYAAPTLVAILALIVMSMLLMFSFMGMGCMTFVCCTKPKTAIDMLDPVIYDARSRLGWFMLYSFAVPIACYPCFYCFVSLAFFIDLTNDYDVLTNEMATRSWNFFFGPTCLIFTFLIIPTYRDTILCGCRYRRHTKKVPVTMVSAPTIVQITETKTTPVVPIHDQKVKPASASEPIFKAKEKLSHEFKLDYPTQKGMMLVEKKEKH